MTLNKNERTFPIKPIGVKYICEFCNNGEMRADVTGEVCAIQTNPPMIPHKCTECGKTMHLPKSYPYIEWVPNEEVDDNGTT